MSKTDPGVYTYQHSHLCVMFKLVCSVQRVSNSGQKVKFNHYRKTDSCSGQRSGQVIFNLYRKSKVGVDCAESRTQAKKLNSITFLRGQRSGQVAAEHVFSTTSAL